MSQIKDRQGFSERIGNFLEKNSQIKTKRKH